MTRTKARTMTMNLLKKETRVKYFKYLNLGEYNSKNVLKFQKIAFTDPKEWDGKYGKKTDAALRHWRNVYYATKSFRPNEFRCPCGKCTGYPVQMKVKELKHIQRIRDHYGKPMVITSALRCSYQNSRVGGVKDSAHLSGRAVDFYMVGVTDTLAHRKQAIGYIRTLPGHKYTYGDGYNSLGQKVYKSSMGKALHTEVQK